MVCLVDLYFMMDVFRWHDDWWRDLLLFSWCAGDGWKKNGCACFSYFFLVVLAACCFAAGQDECFFFFVLIPCFSFFCVSRLLVQRCAKKSPLFAFLFFSQLIAGGCGNRQADVSLVDDWRENEPNMRGRKVMFDGFYVDYEWLFDVLKWKDFFILLFAVYYIIRLVLFCAFASFRVVFAFYRLACLLALKFIMLSWYSYCTVTTCQCGERGLCG